MSGRERLDDLGYDPDPTRCACGGSGWTPGVPDDEFCPYHADPVAVLLSALEEAVAADVAEAESGGKTYLDRERLLRAVRHGRNAMGLGEPERAGAGTNEPACDHGFVGPCAECDGAGQRPEVEP